jgi:O-antigen/teichoic acid export membrane protein
MHDVILGIAVWAAIIFAWAFGVTAVAWWRTAKRLRRFILTVMVPLDGAHEAFREGLVSADVFRTAVEVALRRGRELMR